MKAADVTIGNLYAAKVSGDLVAVELLRWHDDGGWVGRNTKTGREIRIRTAGRLRYHVDRYSKFAAILGYDIMANWKGGAE